MRAAYCFAPGLGLAVEGDAATIAHFDAEYGPARSPGPTTIVVEASVGGSGFARSSGAVPGGHKSMHWRIELAAADSTVLSVRVGLSGWPTSFARSLVQGYFVEPLLSVAAARGDSVLLPAAAFCVEDAAVVVLGRSGSGKTSLSAYALALGVPTFGDDQILVDPDGACRPFPRRLRVYSDLGDRVPLALERLPSRVRAQLRARRLVRMLSRGAVAPALPLPLSTLGQARPIAPLPIRRVIMLERPASPGALRIEPATAVEAVDLAVRLLREQRRHLSGCGGESWREALTLVEGRESRLLAAAFAAASVERVTAPFPLSGRTMPSFGTAVGLNPASAQDD